MIDVSKSKLVTLEKVTNAQRSDKKLNIVEYYNSLTEAQTDKVHERMIHNKSVYTEIAKAEDGEKFSFFPYPLISSKMVEVQKGQQYTVDFGYGKGKQQVTLRGIKDGGHSADKIKKIPIFNKGEKIGEIKVVIVRPTIEWSNGKAKGWDAVYIPEISEPEKESEKESEEQPEKESK